MVLHKRSSVSNCQPGKPLDVQSSLKIPNQRGRYISYYRLYSGDVPFGPILRAEINAVDKVNKVSRQSRKVGFEQPSYGQSKYSQSTNPTNPKGNAIGNSIENSMGNYMGNSKRYPKGNRRRLSMMLSKDIPSVSCLCGEYLMATRPQAIYGNGAMVFCKICGARCASTSTIYHCAMDRNDVHPNGYDLCSDCYGAQLLGALDGQKNKKSKSSNLKSSKFPEPSREQDEKINDVLNTMNLAVSRSDIERFAATISEYRKVFPRFYFLNNVEMVRIIRDPTPQTVSRFMPKMFEGVIGLVLDDENEDVILGLRAVNGEELKFGRMVNAAKKGLRKQAAKWLLKVEYQMRFSLSMQLEESFTAYKNLVDSDAYFEWIRKFPTQIILC